MTQFKHVFKLNQSLWPEHSAQNQQALLITWTVRGIISEGRMDVVKYKEIQADLHYTNPGIQSTHGMILQIYCSIHIAIFVLLSFCGS